MSRKTFEVEQLKTLINNQILHSPNVHIEIREALAMTLESVLHSTGNYSGFQYLDDRSMKFSQHGTSVGINDVSRDTPDDEHYDAQFLNTDRTRVKYF